LFLADTESLKRAREEAKDNAVFQKMMMTLDSIMSPASVLQQDKKAEQKKKRMLLKPLRSYTARQGKEGRFKGWSKRAAADMADLCKKVKKNETKLLYARFRACYRDVWMKRAKAAGKNKQTEETPVVDYYLLWDIPQHTKILEI
jgi:hypothetical protein